MLYKSIISVYGSSISGKSFPKEDVVWRYTQSENLRNFREYVLDALHQAKVYLLDHLAAAYADTLHEAVTENAANDSVPALAILGDVRLPAAVVWVEFDDRALDVARFARGSAATEPLGKGLRGYLLDNRNEGYLRLTMFQKRHEKVILDPLCALMIKRNAFGKLDLDRIEVETIQSMVEFYTLIGTSLEEINGRRAVQLVEAGYDMFIPSALFAMLESPDLGGIIPMETETFTTKDVNTARKFGKSWILRAQKSHITIRIGPQAAAHMAERTARLEFQRQAIETRNGPLRHWVSEHERHYRSGKVVLIKGHHRGHETTRNLPTRVMGPSINATNFELSANEPPIRD